MHLTYPGHSASLICDIDLRRVLRSRRICLASELRISCLGGSHRRRSGVTWIPHPPGDRRRTVPPAPGTPLSTLGDSASARPPSRPSSMPPAGGPRPNSTWSPASVNEKRPSGFSTQTTSTRVSASIPPALSPFLTVTSARARALSLFTTLPQMHPVPLRPHKALGVPTLGQTVNGKDRTAETVAIGLCSHCSCPPSLPFLRVPATSTPC